MGETRNFLKKVQEKVLTTDEAMGSEQSVPVPFRPWDLDFIQSYREELLTSDVRWVIF